jgi:hypothetical protein
MLTVISHIFNEEYLLPFWLEYHSLIFDHGIIIDYLSTDNSLRIINKFCPHWKIIQTRNVNADGTPNFDAALVDREVQEVERTITDGYKICLNTTEFLFFAHRTKEDFVNSLATKLYYHLSSYSVMTRTSDESFFPQHTKEFVQSIDCVYKDEERYHRILHSDSTINYCTGRHWHYGGDAHTNSYDESKAVILWCGFYPKNDQMIKRKLQIQENIPQSDKDAGFGIQHIKNRENIFEMYNKNLQKHVAIPDNISKMINNRCIELTNRNHIYYSELVVDSEWGGDFIKLDGDINLLQNTDFDDTGFKIFDIEGYNDLLQRFVQNEIMFTTGKRVHLENYHNEITSEEHTKILNTMPYKKDMYPDIQLFCEYIEQFVSTILHEPVKIFNDDLWIRICRPNNVCKNDFNPCHRDVYLDFYRNIVNSYVPIIGSNENSSLTLQSGSHKWKENETMVTKGGAFFKYTNKKYSVDAIVASKRPVNMTRPNPTETQLMLFSPYLIHGGANNDNLNTTRISLEVRFIRNDDNGSRQEAEFNQFLKVRNWR